MSTDPAMATTGCGQVHAENHGTVVKIVRSWDGEVLLTLTLAAAENLAHQLDVYAAEGRAMASPIGSTQAGGS